MLKTPFSTWEPQWSETEHEVFRDFGFAAFGAQMLESELITVLLTAEREGTATFQKKADIESELFLSQKTLGALIKELKKVGLDEHTAEMLEDALKARNFLMHQFFTWHSGDFVTTEGRGRMLKELQQLRFRIGRVQVAFSRVREQYVERVFGVSRAELKKMYEDFLRHQREAYST
jgi:hypothetical protein